MQTIEKGVLYIVATPIGNLADLSQRAMDVLAQVDWVAAEDTRHSGKLLQHLAINKRLISLHDYNELARAEVLLQQLKNGESGALISDAGTPLISDPGYHLVKRLRDEGVEVRPIPGASALIAALSVAGMPTDRFCFEGFLPAKSQKRLDQLRGLSDETRTLVFYESPHRLIDCLDALIQVFGDQRRIFIAREMTKQYEQFYADSLGGALDYFSLNADRVRGEFVVVLAGADSSEQALDEQAWDRLIHVLLAQSLPVKQIAQIVAEYFSVKKNQVYPRVLELKTE
ncbi:16S rRNA (cytidine(1402)-2'-O)-methyltransferase [Thiomicrospira microaerophila]|uniref:16S rRNA (cytidine(1402)-2'-O)-methyltransferase n=1 Tax=Thiomicrospira microaerophila TaxID=406020 RepID=UPI00200EA1FB|nr:16S rRNA (cytidine(1402)-2'-O)-methyltransferase [Thiomicrospira microaerophila]UQB42628.1 16S rRNA (cytidine(1402)-2'-O)-methyltransferase [Thiomicrospira microaerophila]